MKNFYYNLAIVLGVFAFIWMIGSTAYAGEKSENICTPPVSHETPPPSPVTPQTPQTPPPVVSPQSSPTNPTSGGGWAGGCSTYPKEILPPWGVVPCVPTSPTQGPAVTPESLNKPLFVKLSSLPPTGVPESEVILMSLIGAIVLTLISAKIKARVS